MAKPRGADCRGFRIQAYLTAVAVNLMRLAAALFPLPSFSSRMIRWRSRRTQLGTDVTLLALAQDLAQPVRARFRDRCRSSGRQG